MRNLLKLQVDAPVVVKAHARLPKEDVWHARMGGIGVNIHRHS